ncbi:MAG: iron chelate uptake ABC transporter family permease subunit [Proteobacteria bacterium]|nr:iron chelate uptake ABC transporter family permease subunit [Pseudomonadota bacterium]
MNLEIFRYAFMQRAFTAGFIISIVSSVIGVFVVLKGLSFAGVGISHAAFGGVALGYFLGINPTLSAIVFCLFVAAIIVYIQRNEKLKSDVPIGIIFAASMGLGAVLISLMKGYNVDLFGYLFGNILSVTHSDIVNIIFLSLIIIAIFLIIFKQLYYTTFDRQMAKVAGVNVVLIDTVFMMLIALTVVISIKVVGIILVSALLVTPAATIIPWAKNFKQLTFLTMITSLFSVITGLFLSYYLNIPSGGAIVLLTTLIFFVSFGFAYKK